MNKIEHIKCGGELIYHHNDGKKSIHICKKCNKFVNVVTCPSYDDYVEMGLIKR